MDEIFNAEFIPEEIREDAHQATLGLLPKKSKGAYEKVFAEFNTWKERSGVKSINEEVLLSYFYTASKKFAVSSLWTKYSMLKTTLQVHMNIDISKFGKLIAFLKSKSRTYTPKKAKILEQEHIKQFLQRAPDEKYLMMKVGLIMGIAGACRCNELTYLKIEDVQDKGSYLFITLAHTKTYVPRNFTVMEEGFSVDALGMCRRYMSLRPASSASQGRFFLRYVDGKCTNQAVGINSMSRIPAAVASFLHLPDASSYTGHSIRRSSATLLINAGGDVMALKRHGGWRSSSVAESYVENSLSNTMKTAEMIQKETSKQVEINHSGESSCETSVPATVNVNLSSPIKQKTNNVLTISVNVNVNLNK